MFPAVSQKELAAHYYAACPSRLPLRSFMLEEDGHRTDVTEFLITETVFPAFLSALSKIYSDS